MSWAMQRDFREPEKQLFLITVSYNRHLIP